MLKNEIIEEIKRRNAALIAVDGRCGAGKTTLAELLKGELSCNVIHMDSFFLRPEQRTPERLKVAGANIDYERFLDEVLLPLKKGIPFSYRPYCCKFRALGEPISVIPTDITIVEGSYSCHPALWDFYDLHIFLDIDSGEQLKRIYAREGAENAKRFADVWIPLEERYFEAYKIEQKCEIKGRL